jgi:hypothetical protein
MLILVSAGINSLTPAEACRINLKIENGWEDLIREATYDQNKLTRFTFNKANTIIFIFYPQQ